MRLVFAGNPMQVRAMRNEGTTQGRPLLIRCLDEVEGGSDAHAAQSGRIRSRRASSSTPARPEPTAAQRPGHPGRNHMEQPMRRMRRAGIGTLRFLQAQSGLYRSMAGLPKMRSRVRAHHLHGVQHVHAPASRCGYPPLWTMHQRRGPRRHFTTHRDRLQGWRRPKTGNRNRADHRFIAKPPFGGQRHNAHIRARKRKGTAAARVRSCTGSRRARFPHDGHAVYAPVRSPAWARPTRIDERTAHGEHARPDARAERPNKEASAKRPHF